MEAFGGRGKGGRIVFDAFYLSLSSAVWYFYLLWPAGYKLKGTR